MATFDGLLRAFLSLLIMSLSTNAAVAGEMVRKFGAEKPVTLKDFGIHLKDVEGYTEQWNHQVWMEDGSFIGMDFVVSNIGIGDHKGAVRVTWISPDKVKTVCRKNYDDDEWSASKNEYLLRFGKNQAKGHLGGINLNVRCKKISMQLQFVNQAPPLKPGGGVLRFGENGVYSMVFSSPRARVTGTLSVKGKTMQIQGVGHATHSYTTMYPHKQVHRWFRFTRLEKDISIIMAEMESVRDYYNSKNGWVLLVDSGGRIASTVRVNFMHDGFIEDTRSGDKYVSPRRVRIIAADGKTQIIGVLMMKKIRSVDDPTKDLDAISRAVVRRFTKPREYKIDCTYEFKIKTEKEERRVKGEGTYKYVYVNP
jgi:hypothetical protein